MTNFVPLGFIRVPDAVKRVADTKSITLDEAWNELRQLLHSGRVAGGYLQHGDVTGARSTWGEEGADLSHRTGMVKIMGMYDRYSLPAFVNDTSLEAYLDGRLAGRTQDSTQESKLDARRDAPTQMTNAEARRPGGRPPKAGVDEFWVEVCRLIHLGEQGAGDQTQKAFVDAMNEWCSNNMASPYGDDAISKKIKMVWRALALGKIR